MNYVRGLQPDFEVGFK